jgi:acyl-CoA dehydrogenase
MDSTADSPGEMLRETASRLFQEHCETKVLREAEQGVWPAAAWAAVEEAGLHRALVPEDAGGFGVAIPDALSLLRVAGEHALPLPLAETMLASWLLAGARLDIPDGPLTVAPVATGESLSLVREGGGWRIEGTATRVPWGRVPGISAVVLAQHDGQNLVASVPTGFFQASPEENLAREPRDTLRFNGVLPAESVKPAADGIGPLQLRAVGAAMRSLQMAGALTRIVAISTQYAQDRVQFGRPIGKFQAVQHNLAVLAGQTAAAIAASDLAAEAVANDVSLLPIAAAKSRAGEAAGLGAGIAHQVHGAIGFTYEHSLHFSTKRLWSWRDEFGNEAEWNLLIGRHMARAGADRLWAEITAA